MTNLPRLMAVAAALTLLADVGQAFARTHDADAPVIEHTQGGDALQALPRLPAAQRKVVTIYTFRSGVAGVQNAAATDMFANALMQSGAFLVAERAQGADVTAERGLNTTGTQGTILPAQLIFEGVISESNVAQDAHQNAVSIGGLTLNGASQTGKIAIDVRVVDPATGLVLDSLVVSKVVRSTTHGVSGLGAFATSVAAARGYAIPLAPDVATQSTHADGVDEALRACIDAAVLELVTRYGGAN
jgi:curli biogenesis system outer membrane secretion channel CsgG